MAEYSREQRTQLSRAIANSEVGSRQLKLFIDNKTCVQNMSVRGTNKVSTLMPKTAEKHVKPLAEQAQAAKEGYGCKTFVVDNTALTVPIDTNTHNFTEKENEKSGRKNINADVNIYEYEKVNQTPEGLKKGEDVQLVDDNKAANCEIGAFKNGVDEIKIDHFKKL